jgi:RNA polymerase sigma-70 factor (ECF subfamily)
VYESDRALVMRLRAGEQRAFHEFFNTSAPRLLAFLARRSGLDTASLEDIVQNSLIKAVRNLERYRGEAALFTWLTEICRHELADVTRKSARRPAHVSLEEPHADPRVEEQLRASESDEPLFQLDSVAQRDAVMQVMQRLPAHYAFALEAKYGDDLSVDDIGLQLGLTPMAAQSLLARAREAFRGQWREVAANLGDVSDISKRRAPQ